MDKGQLSAQQSTNLPTGSLAAQPLSTLQAAILSRIDAGAILKRTHAVLSLYYDPDLDPQTKAELRQEFVVALQTYPGWAIEQAFDRWIATASRRPSPGEIVILATRAMEPILLAVKNKLREQEPVAPGFQPISDEQKDRANYLLERMGFTAKNAAALKLFPMAKSVADVENKITEWETRKPHWSETAPPDDPRWEVLRKSRIAAGMMKDTQ